MTINSTDRIGGAMVNVIDLCAADHGFEPRSGQTRDYKISTCCYPTNHALSNINSKGWLTRNRDNVSE